MQQAPYFRVVWPEAGRIGEGRYGTLSAAVTEACQLVEIQPRLGMAVILHVPSGATVATVEPRGDA